MTDQSSDSTIFNTTPTPVPTGTEKETTTENQTQDPMADLLKTIQAADGRQKYDSIEDALKAMPHAQTHIQTLEDENRSLKEAQDAMAAQLEKVNQIETTLKEMAQNSHTSEEPSVKGLDEQSVAALVSDVLNKREVESSTKSNQVAVADALVAKFGDKAEQMYKDKANELGMSVNQMNTLAGTSKSAVLAWFGATQSNTPAPMSGSINTEGFRDKSTTKPANPLILGNNNLMEAWEHAGTKR